jgi:hypothetical protein
MLNTFIFDNPNTQDVQYNALQNTIHYLNIQIAP